MKKFKNSGKDRFLASIPQTGLEHPDTRITILSKFNFHYFSVQACSQSFSDWNHIELVRLMDAIKEFSGESLTYWKEKRRLVIYGDFPSSAKTQFTRPKHIPHDVLWGRFRLTSRTRVVGFVIPEEYNGKLHARTNQLFDINTFYVAFLDQNHLFWKCEMK